MSAAAVDVILCVAAAHSAKLARDLKLQLGYAERDKAEIERLQAELGEAQARIETDGRELEGLRAALKIAREQVDRNAHGRTKTLAAIDEALADEQSPGVKYHCPHCNKIRRPGWQCCQGDFDDPHRS